MKISYLALFLACLAGFSFATGYVILGILFTILAFCFALLFD